MVCNLLSQIQVSYFHQGYIYLIKNTVKKLYKIDYTIYENLIVKYY